MKITRHSLPGVLLAVICLVLFAGCLIAPAVSQHAEMQAGAAFPAVSIKETPVKYTWVNGTRFAYREFGAGEPLLIIVGFGATMEQANDTAIAAFASKYHVFLYDHRGMGASGRSNASPTIELYADDAADLMQALGYDSMHIYGTSMGSFIAQELALRHPRQVRKMVLDSSAYSMRVPETAALLAYVESVASDPASPSGIRDEARAMLAWNGTWDRLPGIRKNVMLVVGTNDTITPDILSARMAGQIPGSWLIRFEGLPHAGGGVNPVQYGNTALNFLGTNVSAGAL